MPTMTGGDRYARGMVSGGFTPVLENHMQGYLKQFEPKQNPKKTPTWLVVSTPPKNMKVSWDDPG